MGVWWWGQLESDMHSPDSIAAALAAYNDADADPCEWEAAREVLLDEGMIDG
jgi:hypothetical protein